MNMISESYRGFAFMVDFAADRLIVPIAILVSLIGAAMIGTTLADLLGPLFDTGAPVFNQI